MAEHTTLQKPFDFEAPWTDADVQKLDESLRLLFEQLGGLEGLEVFNADTTSLSHGMLVYLSGGAGTVPSVKRARANADATMPAIGFVNGTILKGEIGTILTIGTLEDIDTSGETVGALLYVSSSTAGRFTSTAPSARIQVVGNILLKHKTSGSIFIDIQSQGETHKLLSGTHDDSTAGTVVRGDLAIGQGATATWTRKALGSSGTVPRSDGTDLLYSTFTLADTYTAGDLVHATSASVLSGLADVATGNALISGGVGAVPTYGKIGLTTHVSGDLPFANIVQIDTNRILGRTTASTGDIEVLSVLPSGIDDLYVRVDGTNPLTADWDAGSQKITAETFESDVATGTAPLTVASTTAVSNLNADLLDGVEAAGFALLAGRSGGQTLHGGTGSGDDLHFQTTSNATKGTFFFEEADAVELSSGTTAMELRLREPSGGGTSYTGFIAPALAGNVVYTLPTADGSASDHLSTNGSAVLSWTGAGTVGKTGTPVDNQLGIWTDASTLEGDSDLTFDGTTFIAAGSSGFHINTTGLALVNDTVNSKMTIGLTINQGASTNECLALKSSDVAHGFTAAAETDTYAFFQKVSATGGGLFIRGFSDGDIGTTPTFIFQGIAGDDPDTAKTTSARAIFEIQASQTSGGGFANVGADGNVFVVRARVGGGDVTRILVDEDGDFFSVTAAQTFQDHDDIRLLRTFERLRGGLPKGPRDTNITAADEQELIDLRILGGPITNPPLDRDGRPEPGLTNNTQLQRLQSGALWQLHERILDLEERRRP